ncbi:MAG: RsmE family RNA methyltransferase [Candidatus Onthoplasma sp.]
MDNRYYFSKIEDNQVIIDGQEAQHLLKVRRCALFDCVVGFNGDGYDYHLKITEILKDKVKAKILDKTKNHANDETNTTIYLAMIKNDALSEAIDHLAELNVKHVKLFQSDRTVAVVENKKLDKLRLQSIQASKQCERADIMEISIIEKNEIEKDIKKFENKFFAFEDSTGKIQPFKGDFAVIIGPEGGFSEKENEYFSSFAKNVSLSKTILRAEVACVVAVSSLKAVNYDC